MINVFKVDVSGDERWIAISCSDGGVAVFLDGPAKSFTTLIKKIKAPEDWTFL